MATVAITVNAASAYSIDGNTDYMSDTNILDKSNGHFVFAENNAIKQATVELYSPVFIVKTVNLSPKS